MGVSASINFGLFSASTFELNESSNFDFETIYQVQMKAFVETPRASTSCTERIVLPYYYSEFDRCREARGDHRNGRRDQGHQSAWRSSDPGGRCAECSSELAFERAGSETKLQLEFRFHS